MDKILNRGLAYLLQAGLSAAALALASAFAAAGWIVYNPDTSLVQITFSIQAFSAFMATWVVGTFTGGLAFTAWFKGWTGRKDAPLVLTNPVEPGQ